MSTASFADAMATWHDFYVLTAGVAATLLGLLFVAVSLNLRLFTDPAHPRLRAEATVTFSSFLYLVLIPLISVGPHPRPNGLGGALLVLSGIELAGTQGANSQVRRLLRPGWRGYLLDLAPAVCYLGVMVIALGTLLGHVRLLTDRWMIPLMATLVGTATVNAWELLLAVGTAQLDPNVTP